MNTITLHPRADLLLAYVDKQLDAEGVSEAEDLIASDPDAADFVSQLGISALPFAESFACLLDKPDAIEQSTETIPSLNKSPIDSTQNNNKPSWLWPTSMVASLLMGLVIGFGVFSGDSDSNKNMAENWIAEVANYQLLYVRETVTPAPPLSNKQQLALQKKLSDALDGSLVIPDLSKQQLDFRRGQLLDVNGKPLVQLAYLPKNGLPVALCVLKNNAKDSLPKSGESRGLSYIEWSKNGLSYVLIGKTDIKILESAALSAINQITI